MPTIKLTNDVLLDSSSLKMALDSSNIIASSTKSTSSITYTATQDCIIVFCGPFMLWDTNMIPKINDVPIVSSSNRYTTEWGGYASFILKKGDKIWIYCEANIYYAYKVFGLK